MATARSAGARRLVSPDRKGADESPLGGTERAGARPARARAAGGAGELRPARSVAEHRDVRATPAISPDRSARCWRTCCCRGSALRARCRGWRCWPGRGASPRSAAWAAWRRGSPRCWRRCRCWPRCWPPSPRHRSFAWPTGGRAGRRDRPAARRRRSGGRTRRSGTGRRGGGLDASALALAMTLTLLALGLSAGEWRAAGRVAGRAARSACPAAAMPPACCARLSSAAAWRLRPLAAPAARCARTATRRRRDRSSGASRRPRPASLRRR